MMTRSRLLFVAASLASLIDAAGASGWQVDGAPSTPTHSIELRLASLDGIDADLVYRRMVIDIRSHVVRLRITRSLGAPGLCMGALIDRRYIVTAGHCLKDAKTIEVSRRPERGGPRQVARVAGWVAHPEAETAGAALPATGSQLPSRRNVHLRRDLGVILLAQDFPNPRGSLRLAEEHVLRNWTRAAAVLGFDRDRDTRELTDRLSFIPLRRVRGLAGGGGAVVAGEVGVVFDHELSDLPVPPRLAYCQGDSGAPVLAHLKTTRAGGAVGYEVRLIGVSALGGVPVPRPGRMAARRSVGCFREVVWFSLTDPSVRRWLGEAEALLGRRHCLEARTDPWCVSNRRDGGP